MIYIIILIIIAVIAMWAISTYNNLVKEREMVRNSMGQIAAQIESRWDALSSLISATKKYSDHEAEVLENVTAQRSGISKNSNPNDVEKDDNIFSDAISKINVVAESYPDLKASSVYNTTMNKIDEYENNVRHSRMIYNDTVTKLNRAILTFPNSLVAGMFGFHQEEYFSSSESKQNMPSWD